MDQVNIAVEVLDEDGVAFVRLYYDVGFGFVYTEMLDDGNSGDDQAGDGIYGGFIPAQSDGTLVKYYVLAQDAADASSSLPFDAPSGWCCYKVTHSSILDGEIVINEIMYNNPYSLAADSEWGELYNTTDRTIEMSCWSLRDENDSHRFTFPEGTEIPPHGFLVTCRDLALFKQQYADYPDIPALGEFEFNFGDGGDRVRIFDANDVLMDVVEYGDASASPEDDPDNDGRSNFFEFIAGTAPLDSSSFFSIATIASESDEVAISWPTSPYRYYQVYCSPSVSGPWARLGGARDSASGTLVDDISGVRQRFYRVETW